MHCREVPDWRGYQSVPRQGAVGGSVPCSRAPWQVQVHPLCFWSDLEVNQQSFGSKAPTEPLPPFTLYNMFYALCCTLLSRPKLCPCVSLFVPLCVCVEGVWFPLQAAAWLHSPGRPTQLSLINPIKTQHILQSPSNSPPDCFLHHWYCILLAAQFSYPVCVLFCTFCN